jgi:hypothetical protein
MGYIVKDLFCMSKIRKRITTYPFQVLYRFYSKYTFHRVNKSTIMARTEKNADFIALAKTIPVSIPWCDDYEKMISGMTFVHLPRGALWHSVRLPTYKLTDITHLLPNW